MTAPMRVARQPEGADWGAPVVGKDVLELLSTAMYVDPLTIYREYIQNAADAIDQARAAGQAAGRIEITLDGARREITIRDDAGGIPAATFRRTLASIGASAKRGTAARGFRGVGRLSGLGYARSLTFRSRAVGEGRVSTMAWDCQALRNALRDPNDTSDLTSIIDAITTLTTDEDEGEPFFEVRLEGVARQGDDRLMSSNAVADYLSEVAPVPFDAGFSQSARITETLARSVTAGSLAITVNQGSPLTRPFRDRIAIEGGRPLQLREVAFVEVPSLDGGIGAVGWVAHHDYEGAVHPSTRVRGLRVRSSDVQVGDAGVLADIFPETRFDAWTVGEIHILDQRIVPNGRRDDFERNVHLANLKNHLAPLGRDVANRCRTSSRERKRLRDLELQLAAAQEGIAILAQGSLGAEERECAAIGVESSLARAERLVGAAGLVEHSETESRARIDSLRSELQGASSIDTSTSPLERLPPDRRSFYEEMFGLIYENSTNRASAKSLVDRIMAKIA